MEEKEVKATSTRKRATTKAAPKEVPKDDDLQVKLEQAEKEKQEMLKMMQSLQEQINSMKATQPQIVVPKQGELDQEISVGCRLFCGASLVSPNGDIEISLKFGEETELSIREMQLILRSRFGYKKLFEKGMLYFVDPEMYSYFKIRNPLDLSKDELLAHLLDEDYNKMVAYLSQITQDKKDGMICHTINYNAAMLYIDGKLKDWSYQNRANFESYMGVKIDNLVKMIKDITSKTDLI